MKMEDKPNNHKQICKLLLEKMTGKSFSDNQLETNIFFGLANSLVKEETWTELSNVLESGELDSPLKEFRDNMSKIKEEADKNIEPLLNK